MTLLATLVLTSAQLFWANAAYNEGSKYGLGYTLASIEWAESSFCVNKVNSWSRGCLGIKRKTARLFDPRVTRLQLTDDNARNIRDGLLFLLYCRDHTKDWKQMVYAYHRGLPATLRATREQIDSDGYVLSIAVKVKTLQSMRQDNE